MNQAQLNRTGMFSTVSAYLAQNNSIWSVVPAITVTVGEVNTNIAAIAEKGRKQQTPITGAADEKETVRLDFEEKILAITDQLGALAEKTKNANLAAQVEFSLSRLDKLSDDELEETGTSVSGLGTANLVALADYGLAAADMAALDAAKTKFHGIKTAPRTAIAGRKGETDTIPALISATTSVLRNRLDKQMTKFKKSHPEFFAGYRSARVIVDRGGSSPTPPPPPPAPPAPPAH